MSSSYIQKPISRLEGKSKVTGAAQYAADYKIPDLLHGYVLNSSIPKGKIVAIDTNAAMALEGVLDILTHENRLKLPWFEMLYNDMDAPPGVVFKPLDNEEIKYYGQPIALIVAETFELARYAATLVKVTYVAEPFATCLDTNLDKARDQKKGIATLLLKPPPPKPTGDFEAAYLAAPFKTTSEFRHGAEHHNPMELFATTTVYEGDGKLTIYDKTQGTNNNQAFVANVFGLHYKDVRVLAPFVGGAFGSGLRPQYQLFLSVMAALKLKRNVRVVLDRKQMFTFGHRPQTIQYARFAADANGKLTGLNHKALAETSQFEDYTENVVTWSGMLYPAENTLFEYKLVPLDVYTPLDMRAPGGCTGQHATEIAMDELAYQLNMDPLQLRLVNYSEENPLEKKKYTSKELKQCYLKGAEAFGWNQRHPQPGSMTRGNRLVGYGIATGIWDAIQVPARVELTLTAEGKLLVKSAVTDIGVGTYTAISQIAADACGVALENVSFDYGNSALPLSFIQGGSATTSSLGSAVVIAAEKLKKKLIKLAMRSKDSPLKEVNVKELVCGEGRIYNRSNPSQSVSYTDLVAQTSKRKLSLTITGAPHAFKLRKYAKAVHSAAFIEVEIDKDLKTITVTRALTAVAAGKIINPKTARSQVLGGMVWGISKTLREESIMDEKLGKYMNDNLAEYHIPVHADIHQLEVIFAEENDELINELGIKGVGEIGIVAMPAAISNAIYHATGKRIYKLPIHFDELLDS